MSNAYSASFSSYLKQLKMIEKLSIDAVTDSDY